jgi:ribosomal protein S18 acetylase RimI-like enzyme
MQIDLRRFAPKPRLVDLGYSFHPWNRSMQRAHADAKYSSFRDELDSNVFACLGSRDGCQRLMHEISCRHGFIAEATWLVTHVDSRTRQVRNAGTVQGIQDQAEVGSIQNLGIAPEHRGRGVGTALLVRSLCGFQSVGIKFVTLEVTSHNLGALRLYQRTGFQIVRTVYKSVDLANCW